MEQIHGCNKTYIFCDAHCQRYRLSHSLSPYIYIYIFHFLSLPLLPPSPPLCLPPSLPLALSQLLIHLQLWLCTPLMFQNEYHTDLGGLITTPKPHHAPTRTVLNNSTNLGRFTADQSFITRIYWVSSQWIYYKFCLVSSSKMLSQIFSRKSKKSDNIR